MESSSDSPLWVAVRSYDSVEFTYDEVGLTFDETLDLTWISNRVASVDRSRLGLVFHFGGFAGRVTISDSVIIDIEELIPGTVGSLLPVASGSTRAAISSSHRSPMTVAAIEEIVRSFVEGVGEYVRKGIQRSYLTRSIALQRPRGQVDIGRTLTRHWARGNRTDLHCRFRELTDDTPLNRVLLAASMRSDRLADQVDLHPSDRRMLRTSLLALAGAHLEVAPDFREVQADSRLSTMERSLVSLAQLLIEGVPLLPVDASDPRAASAWVKVDDLFERAVRTLVEDVAIGCSVAHGRGDGTSLLFDSLGQGVKDADPDIVIRSSDGVAVLDVKYRRHLSDITDPEIYQLLAHAVAYGASRAALVVPEWPRATGIRSLGADARGMPVDVIAVDPTDADGIKALVAQWLSPCDASVG